jgi:hypothetical protein
MDIYSTADAPRNARAAYWNSVYTSRFAHVTFDPADRNAFEAELRVGALGPLGIARVQCMSAGIERTRAHAVEQFVARKEAKRTVCICVDCGLLRKGRVRAERGGGSLRRRNEIRQLRWFVDQVNEDAPDIVRHHACSPLVCQIILYRDGRPPPGTASLVPPGGKALLQAGQSVVVHRDPTLKVPLVALSARKLEQADTPQQLQPFVDYWLGGR